MFQHKCRHSPKQPRTIVGNLVEWGSPYTLLLIHISLEYQFEKHILRHIDLTPEKNQFFKYWELDPSSVVFLNCCAMFFCNGLKDFKLKYGHHENVVSLFSNHKINETSCLVNFAKKYYLIWDQYNFFQKVFKTRYKHYKTIGNKIRSILVWFKLI